MPTQGKGGHLRTYGVSSIRFVQEAYGSMGKDLVFGVGRRAIAPRGANVGGHPLLVDERAVEILSGQPQVPEGNNAERLKTVRATTAHTVPYVAPQQRSCTCLVSGKG